MASIKLNDSLADTSISCPICNKVFEKNVVEEHVNKCLFLNSSEENNIKHNKIELNTFKRSNSHLNNNCSHEKRARISTSPSSATAVVSSKASYIFLTRI